MKRTGTRRPRRGAQRKRGRPDRLTRLLAGIAILLTVAILAILVDLWVRPAEKSGRVQADVTTPSPLSQVPTATPSTPLPCTAPADWGTHVVERGDTLYSLAQQYGSDVKTLSRVNCLNDSTILIGQRLWVPGPMALSSFATATTTTASVAPSTATPQPDTLETPIAASPEELEAALSIPTSGFGIEPAFRVNIPNRYLHILLAGIDQRPEKRELGWGRQTSTVRTDAIMILSIDIQDKSVRLLNIPRDLWVYIPGHGDNRINTAYIWAEAEKAGTGMERLEQTIYYNLGIPVHYNVKVDFQGFIEIINALGGVDIDVPCAVPEIGLEPGMHHLDGVHAMQYMQSRDSSSDFERTRRQRDLLMATREQFLTPSIIPKVPALWVTMADNFDTDLPLDRVIGLARLGLEVEPQRIRRAGMDWRYVKDWVTPEGAMVLLPRENELRVMLQEFYSPVDTTRVDKVHKIRIEVLNGSQRRDAEQLAAAALKREGFKVPGTGQAGRRNYSQSQILVYKGDLAAAQQVAEILGVEAAEIQDYTAIPEPPDRSNPAHMRVILGADYDPCQR